MNFALVYVVQRLFSRVGDFFHHWYVDGSRGFFHAFITFLERLDRTFAVRITMRYFFSPLYKDYTAPGRILGVVFRSGRIVIGLAVYAAAACVFLVLYGAWLVLPALLIFSPLYAVRKQ